MSKEKVNLNIQLYLNIRKHPLHILKCAITSNYPRCINEESTARC